MKTHNLDNTDEQATEGISVRDAGWTRGSQRPWRQGIHREDSVVTTSARAARASASRRAASSQGAIDGENRDTYFYRNAGHRPIRYQRRVGFFFLVIVSGMVSDFSIAQ